MRITNSGDPCAAHKTTTNDSFRVLPPLFQHVGGHLGVQTEPVAAWTFRNKVEMSIVFAEKKSM